MALRVKNLGDILADDMGLGKTLTNFHDRRPSGKPKKTIERRNNEVSKNKIVFLFGLGWVGLGWVGLGFGHVYLL